MLGGYAVSHFSWYLKLTVSGHSPSSQSSCVGVGWIYLFHPISYFLFPGNTCACLRYGTFLDVYKRRWSDILGFRSRSLFTSCEVCFALKQALGDKNNTLEGRLVVLKQYRAHLHSQYCDRTVIWRLQAESCEPNSEILLISTDGLDQSKFSLPREPELRNNAGLQLACGWEFELVSPPIMNHSWFVSHKLVKKNSFDFVTTNSPEGKVPTPSC
jgi:hypothetical protein